MLYNNVILWSCSLTCSRYNPKHILMQAALNMTSCFMGCHQRAGRNRFITYSLQDTTDRPAWLTWGKGWLQLYLQTTVNRRQSYAAGEAVGQGHGIFNVEPVDVLLEEAKERQVQSSQPRLLTLKHTIHTPHTCANANRCRHRVQNQKHMTKTCTQVWRSENVLAEPHLGGITIIKCVFDHHVLQHLNGYLTNITKLLQSCTHLP